MADSMPFTQELLTRAHSPTTAAQHHEDRVSRRPLHLRATSHVPSARAVRRIALNTRKANSKQRKTLKPRPLSAEQKRSLGLLEIPKAQQKYAIYEPLHNLWLGYMREILGVDGKGRGDEVERKPYVSAAGAGAMLASADMHGALVEVVRSRCVSRVGVRGIVVRDCKHVFEVVTSRNCVKSIPKEHTMFRFEISLPTTETGETLKPLVFDIIGEQFQNRAPDRAKKTPKMHYQPDM